LGFDIKGGILTEGVEEKIWTKEELSDRRLEKSAQ
jgi:hypothetical protein